MNALCTTRDLELALTEGLSVNLVAPMPGFPQAKRFLLESLAGRYAPFARLRCKDDEAVEFVVVPPGLVVQEYTVEVDAPTAERLELVDPDDALTIAIVTLGDRPTVNLLAPVIVNLRTGMAMQVVLYQSSYEVRHPLLAP